MPALDETVGLPRSSASSSVDSHWADVGSREVGNFKQSVPKFCAILEDFPLWKEHVEVVTSMLGCMSAFLVDYDMMIGERFEEHSIFSLAMV